MSGDVRICEWDGAPLVFTFEFPGAEYVCVDCGRTEGVLGNRADATPELVRRLSEATEIYEREAAERAGRPVPRFVRVGDDGVEIPTCSGCGAAPDVGLLLVGGKPPGWFSRTIDGTTEYACSSACAPGSRLPW